MKYRKILMVFAALVVAVFYIAIFTVPTIVYAFFDYWEKEKKG